MITARQLRALGFTEAAIRHRVATGRLRPLTRGVYTVGPPRGTAEQHWMAAVLVCGEGAALSHRSAAALWHIGVEIRGRIDLSVRRRCEVRRAGLRVRGRPSLSAEAVVERRGIPLTSVVQTLIDLATELPTGPLERAVNEADKHDLIDPEALRAALERRRGEPGVKRLAALLDKRTFRLSDQELERLFRPIAASAGFPVELTKAWVNDFEVDFYWPRLGLVVETDGLRYHRTPAEQARDRLRDQTHTAAGLAQLRFTHDQVKYEATMFGRSWPGRRHDCLPSYAARVARPRWKLTVRSGSDVSHADFDDLDEAVAAMRERALAIRSEGPTRKISSLRDYAPEDQVRARLQLKERGLFGKPVAGVDVRGDGRFVPFAGGVAREELDPSDHDTPFDLVRETLQAEQR